MAEVIIRRNRKRHRRATLFITLVLLATIGIAGITVNVNMRPAMGALATARIKSVAARAMNDAILASMSDEESYASLIEKYDNGERIYLLQANTLKMNTLATNCAQAAHDRIAQMGEQGIFIPIGTVSGIPFLAGMGPSIRVTFHPAGSITSKFNTEFVSSGINQTLYRVNLLLTANVALVMPGISETITVQAEAAIFESIIVGDVPNVYATIGEREWPGDG